MMRYCWPNPPVEYLKANPKAVAAILTLLVAVGIPGAAPLMTCLNVMGPVEALLPLVMTIMMPASELLMAGAMAGALL